ncbi:MAG: 50S ribosomal protein L29 [archaeon]
MALIRKSDIAKMDAKQRKEKLAELKIELIKGSVAANRQNAKTKEIKRAISRILTINNKVEEVKTK